MNPLICSVDLSTLDLEEDLKEQVSSVLTILNSNQSTRMVHQFTRKVSVTESNLDGGTVLVALAFLMRFRFHRALAQ